MSQVWVVCPHPGEDRDARIFRFVNGVPAERSKTVTVSPEVHAHGRTWTIRCPYPKCRQSLTLNDESLALIGQFIDAHPEVTNGYGRIDIDMFQAIVRRMPALRKVAS